MKQANLVALLFVAIISGAALTQFALSKGYLSSAHLAEFDRWFCQQSWFASHAQCRLTPRADVQVPINIDDLTVEELPQAFGNWQMSDVPESEAKAIKEIMAVRSIVESRGLSRQLELSVLSRVYAKYWSSYPEFVVASRCIACGNQRSLLKSLGNSIKTTDGFINDFALSNAEMLPLIAFSERVPKMHLGSVSLMAELLYNGGSHSLISPTMANSKNWDMLHANILNGGAYGALANSKLDDIPFHVVLQAWEKSMARGDFEPRLSQYLLKKGYRPALRLAVWLRAGQYDYLKYSQADKIISMLPNYADFGHLEGEALADYYSSNWQRLRWEDSEQRWRSDSKKI